MGIFGFCGIVVGMIWIGLLIGWFLLCLLGWLLLCGLCCVFVGMVMLVSMVFVSNMVMV